MSNPRKLWQRMEARAQNRRPGKALEDLNSGELVGLLFRALCEELEIELLIDDQTDEARDVGQDAERQSLRSRVLQLEAEVAALKRRF